MLLSRHISLPFISLRYLIPRLKLAFLSFPNYNINMTGKNWRDLVIGVSLITMSAILWFNAHYTLEIGILIGILTLIWLLDK